MTKRFVTRRVATMMGGRPLVRTTLTSALARGRRRARGEMGKEEDSSLSFRRLRIPLQLEKFPQAAGLEKNESKTAPVHPYTH